MRKTISLTFSIGAALVISGCFDGLDKEGNGATTGNNPPPQSNVAPTITGAPPLNVLEGELYEFMPICQRRRRRHP